MGEPIKGVKKMDEEWMKKHWKTENQILTCKLTGLHARREEFTSDGLFIKKFRTEFIKMQNYANKQLDESFTMADYRLLKGYNVANPRTISQHDVWLLKDYFKKMK